MMVPPIETIEALRLELEAAADRGDFEEAAALRDRISILRGAAPNAALDEFDPKGLVRQQPGAMGLGTSQQRVSPPEGWVRPQKPDPMTSGRSKRRERPTSR